MPARSSRGRQILPMRKIDSETHLAVTFSKRRAGVFKKSSELCTLTGAEITMIMESPGGKKHVFGHPSAHAIISRFRGGVNGDDGIESYREEQRKQRVMELSDRLTHLTEAMAAARRKQHANTRREKNGQREFWWQRPIEGMNMDQASWLHEKLTQVHYMVLHQAEMILQAQVEQEEAEMGRQFAAMRTSDEEEYLAFGGEPSINHTTANAVAEEFYRGEGSLTNTVALIPNSAPMPGAPSSSSNQNLGNGGFFPY